MSVGGASLQNRLCPWGYPERGDQEGKHHHAKNRITQMTKNFSGTSKAQFWIVSAPQIPSLRSPAHPVQSCPSSEKQRNAAGQKRSIEPGHVNTSERLKGGNGEYENPHDGASTVQKTFKYTSLPCLSKPTLDISSNCLSPLPTWMFAK